MTFAMTSHPLSQPSAHVRRGALQTPGSVWRWALLGALLGAFCTLLIFAPARWLGHAVQAISLGRVALAQPVGTVWNGSAVLVLSGGAGSTDTARLPGRMAWHLRPAWSHWSLQLHASCCTPQGLALQITPGWQRWGLAVPQAHQSQWPAAILSGLGTPWNTVQLQGSLVVHLESLALQVALDRWSLQGRAQVDAMDIGSRLSTLAPMGSYRLTLLGGTQPTLGLQTLQGPLQLSGTGRWIAQRLRFEGEARAQSPFEAALANLLNILGRRDGERSVITLG